MHTLGIVMDPIESIKPDKDSTLALMLAAQRRGWSLYYFEPGNLWLRDGVSMGSGRRLRVNDDARNWYEYQDTGKTVALGTLDAIIMRVDPPFDMEYIATTYILERAELEGARVVNKPQALRDCNEKVFTAWFSGLTPPTVFSSKKEVLREFHAEFKDVIYKPINGMGGQGVFRVRGDEMNLNAIIEELSDRGARTIVAQKYLPAISSGDKRVLMINGEAISWCLARMPAAGEVRGNLAAGGRGVARPIGDTERRIAEAVGPDLKQRGLLFVGLDIIGSHLTEINVTSPTCIREIDSASGLDIGNMVIEAIEHSL